MCVDVLPAVCGNVWILPAACEIITLLIRPDLPINRRWTDFKSRASPTSAEFRLKLNEIYRRMSSTAFYTFLLLACALKLSVCQTSCSDRCGSEYYRGFMCQCDFSCLSYGECCRDFEAQCTTKNSCLGRCGEAFKRGRLCSCDPDCVKYKQCCPDYKLHCDAEEPTMNEATEEPSTFSEGSDADDYVVPPDGLTDELGDDVNTKIHPVDDSSNNGVEELEATPIPETSSDYGPTEADLLGPGSTDPPVESTTEPDAVSSQTETPPDDAELFTHGSTTGEAPTESSDSSAFIETAPPTSAADEDDSTQPTAASEPQTEPSTSTSIPEVETEAPSEISPTDAVFPSADPEEATSVPSSSIPDASALDSTANTDRDSGDSTAAPEETTSNPNIENDSGDATTVPPSSLADVGDVSTNVPPDGSDLDAVTSDLPPSTDAEQDDATDDVTPEMSSADPLKVTTNPTDPPTSGPTSEPQDTPDKPLPAKATSKPEKKPPNVWQTSDVDDTRGFQGDDSNDTNLCSGRPVGAVATLRNGTVAVFRGHYFWFLDRNRVPGPARGITQVWGVPSPVDTVFTRCNCQGKTYIFKGNRYWRFENDALDPGYPKAVSMGFDGLRGHITAALSVPQHQARRESVYFFKRGGHVQKYSYQFGTSPTCSRKPQFSIYTVRNRVVRQAVSVLEPAINIRTTWTGFPQTITAAVSIPNSREPEGYKYYVFSRTKSYNVRMSGERPVIDAPKANSSPQSNHIFKCPKKV